MTGSPGIPGDRKDPGAAEVDGNSHAAASRPLVERLLLMLVAFAMAFGFFFMGAASWASGEPALGIFGLLGGLMTLWVGGLTLRR